MQTRKNKYNVLVWILASIVFLIGLYLISYKYIYQYKDQKNNEEKMDNYFKIHDEIVNTNIELENEKEDTIYYQEDDYISVIEIPKIDLKRGIYSKESILNDVDKNIYLLKESDMPDKISGNFILAAHSGNTYVSFFKNLSILEIDDIAYIYYNGLKYKYHLINYYEIEKNGRANIIRNLEKNTLTLITCKGNTNKQLIFIFELIGVEE